VSRFLSTLLLLALLVTPLAAQQRGAPPPAQTTTTVDAPAFDDLLSTDAYKLYGEVRNVGTLLSNGGAGEIVDPIVKLADPGPQFKSIISFLKKNSEVLAQARLMFAAWPARTDVPATFVAIEFPTKEDAAKFAPKLETFLPTVLPPVPVLPDAESQPKATDGKQPTLNSEKPGARPTPPAEAPGETPKPVRIARTETSRVVEQSVPLQSEERLPFVITHAGNLVCISDKNFKFSKLHPKDSRPLFQDQNFRQARDQFSSEPIFFFFNVALEDKTKPSPSPTPLITAEAAARRKGADTDDSPDEKPQEAARDRAGAGEPSPDPNRSNEQQTAVLVAAPAVSASPTPTPAKDEQARRIASNQIGQLMDSIGYGEPQWPDAVGLAVELSGNEYIVRAIMIDKPNAKKTPIPFVPQLIGGPAFNSDAASVLPEDTDVLISASVDLAQTYEGMKRETEKRHKADTSPRSTTYENGVMVAAGRPGNESPDAFAAFEKDAGLKIKEDLLPVFGHEIAIAGSLKTINAMGVGLSGIPVPKSSEAAADKDAEAQKKQPTLPALLIEVRDRDAARAMMPKVLNGLGLGEANLIAQTEKHGDTEIVNYAGVVAYGFVGDFLVLSDALGVQKIVDAYTNHQTLSSNTVFRNSRRWQSTRTTGQIYISPSMMQGFQDDVRKKAATMDADLRDFLLSLNPNAEAITYALADDGMGTRHELRLPKNYILMSIASISSATKNPPPEMNEGVAMGMLGTLANIETQYKTGPGKGNYANMTQLLESKMFPQEVVDKYGYNFDVTVSGEQFEAVATPKEYGKTGKRSFFVDKSGVVRGDDHGGAPATVADKPVQQ